tara:strand:+ start:141 stop:650 length:510 start_codon:yes stop_codon:yes gene_type:complete
MKHLWFILLSSFSLAWSQDLTLKNNNKTAAITHNQPIEIISKDNDVLKGRFQKVENNSIILEGRIIAIDQVKQIKLPYSRLKSAFKGFQKGGQFCGGITIPLFGIFYAVELYDENDVILGVMFVTPFAALLGGGLNAIRHFFKAESSFMIDQDNWRIVTDIVSLKRKKK